MAGKLLQHVIMTLPHWQQASGISNANTIWELPERLAANYLDFLKYAIAPENEIPDFFKEMRAWKSLKNIIWAEEEKSWRLRVFRCPN